jgi:hypothetical protein
MSIWFTANKLTFSSDKQNIILGKIMQRESFLSYVAFVCMAQYLAPATLAI